MMNETPDEGRAARLALKTLLAAGDGSLPVDVKGIIKRCRGTVLFTYEQAGRMLGESVFGMAGILPSTLACTLRKEGPGGVKYIILYNDDECFGSFQRRRFSLAHELGHIVLKHSRQCPVSEREADLFAQCLLCPAPVMDRLPDPDPDLAAVAFGVSRAAARAALRDRARMGNMIDRELYRKAQAFFGAEQRSGATLLSGMQRAAYAIRKRRRISFQASEDI